jgi:hypothetical protein
MSSAFFSSAYGEVINAPITQDEVRSAVIAAKHPGQQDQFRVSR